MKKIYISFIVLLLSISSFSQENTIEVEGIVTDSHEEPLIGVNIIVKDIPGLGTVTDLDGKYKIRIEPYHRLIFSYIGFDNVEVLIKEQRKVDVIMQESESTSLDEIVVTGTGVQKKLTVTGAISNVSKFKTVFGNLSVE